MRNMFNLHRRTIKVNDKIIKRVKTVVWESRTGILELWVREKNGKYKYLTFKNVLNCYFKDKEINFHTIDYYMTNRR